MDTNMMNILIRIIDQSLVGNPDMSLQQFRDAMAAAIATMTAAREQAVCRRCGKDISRHEDGQWYHNDPDQCRGCRAASYRHREDRADGEREPLYDESLNRRWSATPRK